jgi:hypothetical protein
MKEGGERGNGWREGLELSMAVQNNFTCFFETNKLLLTLKKISSLCQDHCPPSKLPSNIFQDINCTILPQSDIYFFSEKVTRAC